MAWRTYKNDVVELVDVRIHPITAVVDGDWSEIDVA